MPTSPVVRASLRSAERADLNDLVALLGAAVPQCLPETVWQLPWAWSTYVVVRDGDRLVAAGSLQRVDERRAEIRGLVVAPSHQGNGLASAVVEELLRRGRERGLDVLCVTRKPAFFSRFGFRETRPDWLRHERRLGASPVAADPPAPGRVAMVARQMPAPRPSRQPAPMTARAGRAA